MVDHQRPRSLINGRSDLSYLREGCDRHGSGDLAGTTSFDLRLFLRPDFSSFGWATETFTGTVPDLGSGTMLWLERATGGADGSALVEALVVGGHRRLRRPARSDHVQLRPLPARNVRRNVLGLPERLVVRPATALLDRRAARRAARRFRVRRRWSIVRLEWKPPRRHLDNERRVLKGHE